MIVTSSLSPLLLTEHDNFFLHSPNQINVFWRSRRCCRRPCLSSEGDNGGESEEEDEDEETVEM